VLQLYCEVLCASCAEASDGVAAAAAAGGGAGGAGGAGSGAGSSGAAAAAAPPPPPPGGASVRAHLDMLRTLSSLARELRSSIGGFEVRDATYIIHAHAHARARMPARTPYI